jgi:imidazole glycerol-phosphate synthase subunit HisF
MFRPRVIPVLLLKKSGLVKSINFKNHKYIGDPINAVKIFNDLKADELVFLDILASKEKRKVSLDFVKNVGSEANMPFGVGGGIKSIDDIREIISAGAEKVILNTHAFLNPNFIKEASDEFGSSTITVSIDVKKTLFKGKRVFIYSGTKMTKLDPIKYSKIVEEMGAGEIIINSIDNDGVMEGYDIDLIKEISQNVSIPVVALGGAGDLNHFAEAIDTGFASAVAAGSKFVYQGSRRAVLVNYPSKEVLNKTFEDVKR